MGNKSKKPVPPVPTPTPTTPKTSPEDLAGAGLASSYSPQKEVRSLRKEPPHESTWKRPLSPLERQVDRAIHDGVQYLIKNQREDGSWDDRNPKQQTRTTSRVTLALLAAGQKATCAPVSRALLYLRRFEPSQIDCAYCVSLQTRVFVAAGSELDRDRISANVKWLEHAQIKPGDGFAWPGSWVESVIKSRQSAGSYMTKDALLGLGAARQVGVSVSPAVWALARAYYRASQRPGGGWGPAPDSGPLTTSSICAGLTGLIISKHWDSPSPQSPAIHDCRGSVSADADVRLGIEALMDRLAVNQDLGRDQDMRFYSLCALECVGQLTGRRSFGTDDWYRRGAQDLVDSQITNGAWKGVGDESHEPWATSFALEFLAWGRRPIMINKLRHLPSGDWENDAEDVSNLVASFSRSRRALFRWQIVNPLTASVDDLLESAHAVLERAPGPDVHCGGKNSSSAICRARRVHPCRLVLLVPRVRFRLQAGHEGSLSRGQSQASTTGRGAPGLESEPGPETRSLRALGNTERFPNCGHLLSRRSLLLLE